jgi:hypothetical protein
MVGEGVEDRRNWAETCRREAAIRDLLNRYPKHAKGGAVDDVAWELGVSRASRGFVQLTFAIPPTVHERLRRSRARIPRLLPLN